MGDDRIWVAGIAPCDRANARCQFGKIEWLYKIVVCAGVQPFDPVGHLVQCGQDDHRRHVTPRAQARQKADAATIRQHQIQQHQIVGRTCKGIAGRVEPHDPIHRLSRPCDFISHGGPQNSIVLDKQDAHSSSLFFPDDPS